MGLLKSSMLFIAPPKGRSGFRPFGCELGRFCLSYLVFSFFLAAKRRRFAAETNVVENRKTHSEFFGSPLFNFNAYFFGNPLFTNRENSVIMKNPIIECRAIRFFRAFERKTPKSERRKAGVPEMSPWIGCRRFYRRLSFLKKKARGERREAREGR